MNMKILKINFSVSPTTEANFNIDELEVIETEKSYKLPKGRFLAKANLGINFSKVVSHLELINFVTYCKIEDREITLEQIRTWVQEQIKYRQQKINNTIQNFQKYMR